ncbi:hypothetical protein ACPPVO_24435 [Dactylosporangium sp. McL0621]|uniref:hypothetical protein n=1 Tax=Dactylosporangium sp. McL0621 TaxID=3415678 RepID=UPI003CECB527
MYENRPDDDPEAVAAASHDHDPPIQIVYPAVMDDGDWSITEAKGWIEATLRWAGMQKTITFYDPIRFAQEVQSAVDRSGYFRRDLRRGGTCSDKGSDRNGSRSDRAERLRGHRLKRSSSARHEGAAPPRGSPSVTRTRLPCAPTAA